MIQCFIKKRSHLTLRPDEYPRLLFASKIDFEYVKHPRIMHKHPDYAEILFVRSGSGVYIVNTTRYPVKKGDIIICNKGILHDEIPEKSDNLNTYCLAIDNLRTDGLAENCIIPNDVYPIFASGERYQDLHQLFSFIFSRLSSGDPESDDVCQLTTLALLEMLQAIIRTDSEQLPTSETDLRALCKSVEKFIDENYMEDISLEVVSKAVNLSPFYLSHVFKDITGYSPMQYILRRRIGEAQTLLISTKLSITEIASRVGYGNPNSFNIIFTKNVGMSASSYRKNYVVRHPD